jgi:hypothetical protein
LSKNKTHNLLSSVIGSGVAFSGGVALCIAGLPLGRPCGFGVGVVGWAAGLAGWVACLGLCGRAGLLEVVVNGWRLEVAG